MKRLLSTVATLCGLAVALAAPMAAAQDDLTPTDEPITAGTATTGDSSLPNTAGPLPLIAIAGALLMVGGIREGLRRRTDA